ncbi:hypothetical protein, partial [Streptomyces sp. NPDC005407]|uniref:hypothetical protein n=1 Tax=Streptomyces sp. NPDC005407 TaxID=3155340 RepID=UPI0033A7F003
MHLQDGTEDRAFAVRLGLCQPGQFDAQGEPYSRVVTRGDVRSPGALVGEVLRLGRGEGGASGGDRRGGGAGNRCPASGSSRRHSGSSTTRAWTRS